MVRKPRAESLPNGKHGVMRAENLTVSAAKLGIANRLGAKSVALKTRKSSIERLGHKQALFGCFELS